MHIAVTRAREHFLTMPEDVFNQWLHEVVAERGWPTVTGDSIAVPIEWRAFFMNQSLSYWSSLDWKLEERIFEDIPLEQEALQKAALIVQEAQTGKQVFRVPIENSAARLTSCLEYLRANGQLPRPIICVEGPSGEWFLVDGHHRLAALIGSVAPDQLDNFSVQVWLGQHQGTSTPSA